MKLFATIRRRRLERAQSKLLRHIAIHGLRVFGELRDRRDHLRARVVALGSTP